MLFMSDLYLEHHADTLTHLLEELEFTPSRSVAQSTELPSCSFLFFFSVGEHLIYLDQQRIY